MAGLTQAAAEARLQQYMDAEEKVLGGQEYQIGTRRLKRADLKEIREGIEYWQAQVKRLASGGGAKVRGLSIG